MFKFNYLEQLKSVDRAYAQIDGNAKLLSRLFITDPVSGEVRSISLTSTSTLSTNKKIGLFINDSYVDYDISNNGAEASNLDEWLDSESFDFIKFTDINYSGITLVTSQNGILILPELENGNLLDDLSEEVMETISNYIFTGGRIYVFYKSGGIISLINSLFDWSISPVSCNSPINKSDLSTTFTTLPGSLVNANATTSLNATSLPTTNQVIYSDSLGNPVVCTLPHGLGEVVFMGWDWFNAAPTGSQDGGWNQVLKFLLDR